MRLAVDFIVYPAETFERIRHQAGGLIRRVNHIPCYLCLAIEREHLGLILLDALPSQAPGADARLISPPTDSL